MYCPRCGTQLQEGKGFCMHCGARLSDYAQPAPPPLPGDRGQAPPPPTPPTPPSAGGAYPPLTPPSAGRAYPPPAPPSAGAAYPPPWPTPPGAAPPYQAPPSAPAPYQPPPGAAPSYQATPGTAPPPLYSQSPPPFQPGGPSAIPFPPGPARGDSGQRPGWVVPFLAVMGVIIVGSFIGLLVVLFGGDGDSPKATETIPTGTTLSATTSPSGPSTETTASGGGAGTTATIPGYDPGSTATSSPSGVGGEGAYVEALDGLESVLSYADARIPELAQEINATAPGVPDWVSRELRDLSDDVETAQDGLAAVDPPARYQRADDLIFQATDEMLYRIDQTSQGIDAMWASGKVASGNPYFEEGRKARDAYRRLFDQYRGARP